MKLKLTFPEVVGLAGMRAVCVTSVLLLAVEGPLPLRSPGQPETIKLLQVCDSGPAPSSPLASDADASFETPQSPHRARALP